MTVVCKVYDPSITGVRPDGYWYLIQTSPWNGQYWAAANTFMNGDTWGCWTNTSCFHTTDFRCTDMLIFTRQTAGQQYVALVT